MVAYFTVNFYQLNTRIVTRKSVYVKTNSAPGKIHLSPWGAVLYSAVLTGYLFRINKITFILSYSSSSGNSDKQQNNTTKPIADNMYSPTPFSKPTMLHPHSPTDVVRPLILRLELNKMELLL
jgi:hypothetical protein